MLDEVGRLIVDISQNNNTAFEKLYIKTRRGVYAFLYTYFQNSHDTEDAMQMVYLKIKKNCSQFKKGTNGRAWILQIAKNHAIDTLRKNRNTLSLDDLNIPATTDNIDSSGTVFSAMQKVLSIEEQQILVFHVLWGYKHKEIAKEFDLPLGTVLSKYKRAIEKLKKELKEGD